MTVELSGSALKTLVSVLCVTPILLHIYGSIGSVGSFSEGSALRDFYSNSRLHSEGGYDQILAFRPHFQKISVWIMMHLPIRKDYCGELMHHPGVSNLMALFMKMGYVYTITSPRNHCQDKTDYFLHNGLPVHAYARTGKPLSHQCSSSKSRKNSATAGGTGGCGPLVDQRAASARRPLINSPGAVVSP